MKSNRGYYGIGVFHIKTPMNYGSLFRTAQIMDADFLFTIGARFKPQASDTMKSWRHIPIFHFKDIDDFNTHRPYDCILVGIELHKKAIPIKSFSHPQRCIYLLGAEDSGLSNTAMEKCQTIVQLPGERSMNVAVAGSIIMFDRINKLV